MLPHDLTVLALMKNITGLLLNRVIKVEYTQWFLDNIVIKCLFIVNEIFTWNVGQSSLASVHLLSQITRIRETHRTKDNKLQQNNIWSHCYSNGSI
jgi:hypothetical protein